MDIRLFSRHLLPTAGLAYLPLVRVSEQEAPTLGLRSDVGIALAPTRFPIAFQLDYRIERFEFPAGSGRSDQFEAFTLSVEVRMRRLRLGS